MDQIPVLNLLLFMTIGPQPLLALMGIDLAALPLTSTGHVVSLYNSKQSIMMNGPEPTTPRQRRHWHAVILTA